MSKKVISVVLFFVFVIALGCSSSKSSSGKKSRGPVNSTGKMGYNRK